MRSFNKDARAYPMCYIWVGIYVVCVVYVCSRHILWTPILDKMFCVHDMMWMPYRKYFRNIIIIMVYTFIPYAVYIIYTYTHRSAYDTREKDKRNYLCTTSSLLSFSIFFFFIMRTAKCKQRMCPARASGPFSVQQCDIRHTHTHTIRKQTNKQKRKTKNCVCGPVIFPRKQSE